MKRILYFDCAAGISGDMTLGALVHLGANEDELRARLAKLGVSGYEITSRRDQMNGITGVNLDVILTENEDAAHEGHTHEAHDHAHGDHTHDHAHRSFRFIRDLILRSDLNARVKASAISIFTVIAEAEAVIHDMPVEEVVFHEVGAVDSIVDVVGAAICVDMLAVDEIYCSPLHDGNGFIRCRHGLIPVPVPAVMEILKGSDIRIVCEDVGTELVTPTGAGILKGLGARCARLPEMRVTGVGYGFGKRKTGRFNALRAVTGEIE